MVDPAELVGVLRGAVRDDAVAAVAIEHDLVPVDGEGSPVKPPTYAPPRREDPPEFPVSPAGTVPLVHESGWLSGVAVGSDGLSVSAPMVIVDDVQSQSARVSQVLWEHRVEFGGLPGFVVRGDDGDVPRTGTNTVDAVLTDVSLSSWIASHRHADSWIQMAAESVGGVPVWKARESGVGALLTRLNSTDDASEAFAYAPNSLLFGFWLSSGVPRFHKQARVYRTRIVGYGAKEVYSAATKVDPLPVSRGTVVDRKALGVAESKRKENRPSNLGFGPNPGGLRVRGFSCDRIAARGAISLSSLRAMQFGGDQAKQEAAAVALTVLGLAGDALVRRRTHLRDGCDLVALASRYGLRRQGRVLPEELPVDVAASPQWWSTALRAALEECSAAGLEFAEPVTLYLSGEEQRMLREGAAAQSSGASVEGEQ